jgi:hypothetical protein
MLARLSLIPTQAKGGLEWATRRLAFDTASSLSYFQPQFDDFHHELVAGH